MCSNQAKQKQSMYFVLLMKFKSLMTLFTSSSATAVTKKFPFVSEAQALLFTVSSLRKLKKSKRIKTFSRSSTSGLNTLTRM